MANIVGSSGKTLISKIVEGVSNFLTSAKREEALIEYVSTEQLNADTKVGAICYDAWMKAHADLLKIDRPDVIAYDKDRKPIREEFSKDRLDAIQKAKERIDKIERAMTKAIEKGDMKDARDVAQQHSSKDKGGSGGKSKEELPSETT